MPRCTVTQIEHTAEFSQMGYNVGDEIKLPGRTVLLVERIMSAEELEMRDEIQAVVARMYPSELRKYYRRNA